MSCTFFLVWGAISAFFLFPISILFFFLLFFWRKAVQQLPYVGIISTGYHPQPPWSMFLTVCGYYVVAVRNEGQRWPNSQSGGSDRNDLISDRSVPDYTGLRPLLYTFFSEVFGAVACLIIVDYALHCTHFFESPRGRWLLAGGE